MTKSNVILSEAKNLSSMINPHSETYCLLDVGNSRTKVSVASRRAAFSYSGGWAAKLINFIAGSGQKPSTIVVSSVNERRLAAILKVLDAKFNYNLIHAKSLLDRQTEIDFSSIKGMGVDRATGLFGALSRHESPLITVDCGTAITINALDEKSVCIGGAIFAGVYTQMQALSRTASGIEAIELEPVAEPCGVTSADALKAGIILASAGGITEIIIRIVQKHFHGATVSVFVTGGYGSWMMPLIKLPKANIEYCEYLVLDGLEYLLKTAR